MATVVQKASYVIGVALTSILLSGGAVVHAQTGFPEIDGPQEKVDAAKMIMSDWDKRRADWAKNPPSREYCESLDFLPDAKRADCHSAWVDGLKKETGLSEEDLTKRAKDDGDTPCPKGLYCKKGQAGEATDGSETEQSEIEEIEENNQRAGLSDDPLTEKVPDNGSDLEGSSDTPGATPTEQDDQAPNEQTQSDPPSAKDLYNDANLQSPPPQEYVPINQEFDGGLEGMPAEAGSSSKDLMRVYNYEQQLQRAEEQERWNDWEEENRRATEIYTKQTENSEEAQRRREHYETAERQLQEMQAQQQYQQQQQRNDRSAQAFSSFMSGFTQQLLQQQQLQQQLQQRRQDGWGEIGCGTPGWDASDSCP